LDIMFARTTKRADERKLSACDSSSASVEASRVISGNILTRAGTQLARGLLLLPVLVLLSGCDPDPYPANMTYPARADLLVIKAEGAGISQTFGPGQLDHFVNTI